MQVTKFLDDFGDASDDVLRALDDEVDLVSIWKNNPTNINRVNLTWLKWIKEGRLRVVELSNEALKHIYKGEIRIKFKDGTPDFVSTPEKIWIDFETKFMSDATFAEAVLKTDNLGKQTFSGLHSIDEIDALANTTLLNGKKLLEYSSKTPILEANGKAAFEVLDPKVMMPSIDKLKAINKNKPINQRVWATDEKAISKSEGISTTFFEGMSENQVGIMISEAFVVKDMIPGSTVKWQSTINYNNSNVNIKLEGYFRSNLIETTYIIK